MRKIYFVRAMLLMLLFSVLLVGCKEIPKENDTVKETEEKTIEIPPEQQVEKELISALVYYLQDFNTFYDQGDSSMSIKMDKIKNGTQLLRVDYRGSGNYFVCAYFDGNLKEEKRSYSHAESYIWVKFENANEICETYQGLPILAAFQLNPASSVWDATNRSDSLPRVEHFDLYKPSFSNGRNTNDAIVFDRTILYLNSPDQTTVYHSVSEHDHVLKTIPYVRLDGQDYITEWIYSIYADGTRTEMDDLASYGKYKDAVIKVMDTERYSVTRESKTDYYGIIKLEDFVRCILG